MLHIVQIFNILVLLPLISLLTDIHVSAEPTLTCGNNPGPRDPQPYPRGLSPKDYDGMRGMQFLCSAVSTYKNVGCVCIQLSSGKPFLRCPEPRPKADESNQEFGVRLTLWESFAETCEENCKCLPDFESMLKALDLDEKSSSRSRKSSYSSVSGGRASTQRVTRPTTPDLSYSRSGFSGRCYSRTPYAVGGRLVGGCAATNDCVGEGCKCYAQPRGSLSSWVGICQAISSVSMSSFPKLKPRELGKSWEQRTIEI